MNWLILAVMLNGKTKDVDHLKFNSYNDCASAVQAIQAKEVVVDLFNRTNNRVCSKVIVAKKRKR